MWLRSGIKSGSDLERMWKGWEKHGVTSPRNLSSVDYSAPPRQFPQIAGIPRMCANVWEPWKRQATIGWF